MDANHTLTAVYVTPPRTLTVASSNPNSGVSVTVGPNDNNGAGNGATQFTRTYNNNVVVSLTAPGTASGNNFQKWLKDGADFANNQLANVSVMMDANHTMTAVYLSPTPTLSFTTASFGAAESGPGLQVVISRTGNVSGSATIDYATSDSAGATQCGVINGNASSRCDYLTHLAPCRLPQASRQRR